jgi:exodeoxyribonuclease VII large subunit
LQRLDDLQGGLSRRLRSGFQNLRNATEGLRLRLRRLRPSHVLRQRRELLGQRRERLRELAERQLQGKRHHWDGLNGRLRLLSPEHVLARGYSITLDAASGRVVRSAAETQPGQELKTKVKTGEIRSIVTVGNGG